MSDNAPDDGPVIYVIDDHDDVRETLVMLLESVRLETRAFGSATAFLDAYVETGYGCVLADVRMPQMSGLELQVEMNRRGIELPVIIITGFGDVEMAVNAMKAGAVDFIEKPYNEQDLLDRVHRAVGESATRRRESGEAAVARGQLRQLTGREREVLDFIVAGEPNKRIAHHLGLSEKTVEFHRSNIMRKLEARSVAELVKKAMTAGSGDGGPA